MNDKFEELFKAMHQFHKLRIGEMMPNVSGADFWAMNNIVNKSEDGKITISELAKKTNVLPSAISRTIRGLEDKGYVERTINKNDRRNTYVEMTDRGNKSILMNPTDPFQLEMKKPIHFLLFMNSKNL